MEKWLQMKDELQKAWLTDTKLLLTLRPQTGKSRFGYFGRKVTFAEI